MDAVTLARIQFAFTVGYHFIFVPISIGVGMMVVLSERRYYKSGIAADRAASNFWIKLFTATFAIGVATGITMEFAFGTNWANYSRFVGNIFGAPLAAEGLIAFFLESTFLGILLFGRKKVSKGFYYVSAWLVWIGSLLSALWILIANSWMQTPAGYKIENGKAILTSFWGAALNPSIGPRYFHTVAAALLTGCFVVAGVCAYYLLKKKHLHFARQAIIWAASVGLVLAIAMPFLGHWGALVVAEKQPMKMAAFENVTDTEDGATLWLVGWLTKEADGTYDTHGIGIPNGLSLILHLNPDAKVTGYTDVPQADRPPIPADLPELPPDDRARRVLRPRSAGDGAHAHPQAPGERALAPLGAHRLHPALAPRHQHGMDGRGGRTPALDRARPHAHDRRRVAARLQRPDLDHARPVRPDLPRPVRRLAADLRRHHQEGPRRPGGDAGGGAGHRARSRRCGEVTR